MAASAFYENGKYNLGFKDSAREFHDYFTSDKLIQLYNELLVKYPIISIEDPFDQDDWKPWANFTKQSRIQVFHISVLLLILIK